MYQTLLRRIVLTIPTLVIVSFITFAMVRLLPGDVVYARLGDNYTEEQASIVREQLGLNRPWPTAYIEWIGGVVRGNLGTSLEVDQHQVSDRIKKYLPVTLELMLLAVLFSVLMGIPIGIFAAIRQDSIGDYLLRSFAILGLSVPGFYIAVQFLGVLAKQWGWIPPIGYTSLVDNPANNLSQFWMPAFILSLNTSAQLMRMTRAMMLEVQRQDYIRTAWAKGLQSRTIIIRHALRNTLLPVVTVLGLTMVFLMGGTVIFESIFNLPGMGSYLIKSVSARDYPAVQGIALVFGVSVVMTNLLIDLSYTLLDPRVKGA